MQPMRTSRATPGTREGGPARALRSALVGGVLSDGTGPGAAPPTSVEAFVDGRIGSMAAHVRLGVAVVEALLVLRAFAVTRRGPASLSPPEADRLMRAWEGSRLAPVADYVRLVRSLALLGAFEPTRAERSSP